MQSKQINQRILGVLGGGQLGRMLIQETISFNQEVYVLDPDANAPCSLLANKFVQGDFKDYETVLNFGRQVDVLTIEIEQVNVDALLQLEKDGVSVFPQPDIIKMIQDKGLQKQFFLENNIPTSPFKLINHESDLLNTESSWFPCFYKSRKDGYDGKGVQFIHSKMELEKFPIGTYILEKAIDINMEFAVIIAANGQGDFSSFPLVDMIFDPKLNLVSIVSSPSILPENTQKKAVLIAEDIARKTKIQGLLAIEFFLTKDGDVLVNEMAPRPHNSGHHTIEGNYASQFEQHYRSVMGLPLGNSDLIKPSAMINLIGAEGYTGAMKVQGLEEVLSFPNVYLHLYGKKITKPGRKMGHVTILADTIQEAHKIAHIVKEKLQIIS